MKSIFKFVKFIVFMCILILCVGVGYFAYSGYNLYKQKIDEIPLDEMVSSIKSKDNYVGYDSIALDFFHAIVAIEDKRFYYHKGVDLASVIRAIVTDYNNKELSQGGSTITQQLAKNMYFSQEKSFTRKFAEIITAIEIEKQFSKEEILELYANIVYFGDGYYGIYDASNGYFNALPINLDLNQSTLLASIPNAPSVYALSNNNEDTYKRQIQVLEAMQDLGYVTDTDVQAFKNK